MRQSVSLFYLVSIAASGALAVKRPFSIHDDVLAYPQYDVLFPDEYVLESEASTLLQLQKEWSSGHKSSANAGSDKQDIGRYASQKPLGATPNRGHKERGRGGGGGGAEDLDWNPEALLDYFTYEEMKLDGLRYLCNIPRVGDNSPGVNDTTTFDGADDAAKNQTQEENEIARATDRGLELLQEMEDSCMYYVSGWWSYSFCYKKQVKQFHARSGPGVPNYPPIEDGHTHSYVLGKFQLDDDEEQEEGQSKSDGKRAAETTSTAELQTKGESRYLVQRLGGGTVCDLTGAERKVEVQFHCHPQSTDRIGWIKELTTCSYLMVIYTPRLCHDVAFQLPQPEETHSIQCREILAPDEIADFEAMKAHHESQKLLVNSGVEEEDVKIVGGIEVGAKKQVGSEGKIIERGRMARIGEESVVLIAKREGDKISQMPKEELSKRDMDAKQIESLRNRLDEMSDGRDWKLELVESNGDRAIRAIVDAGPEDEGDTGAISMEFGDSSNPKRDDDSKRASADGESDGDAGSGNSNAKYDEIPEDQGMGSEETFKDEL